MIGEKVRSLLSPRTGGRSDGPAPDDETGTTTRSDSSLFDCPECDAVYVAAEMEVCSNCATDVREVSSTLTGD